MSFLIKRLSRSLARLPTLEHGEQSSGVGRARRSRRALRHLTAGGTTGNERLTAATGAMLLVPVAVIGVTIISLRSLLWVHLFVGMLLIGPVALKLASTGYRFIRYYTGNPSYRREGPPPALLRVIAPMVVLSTVVVFASGVALLFAGPSSRETLLPIHKISFFVWAAFTGVHLLGHLPALPGRCAPTTGLPHSRVMTRPAAPAASSHLRARSRPGRCSRSS